MCMFESLVYVLRDKLVPLKCIKTFKRGNLPEYHMKILLQVIDLCELPRQLSLIMQQFKGKEDASCYLRPTYFSSK